MQQVILHATCMIFFISDCCQVDCWGFTDTASCMSRAVLHTAIMNFYFRLLSSYWFWLADTACSMPRVILHAGCMADIGIWQIVVMLIKLLTS
jgi:hypothetical protein